MNKKLILGMVLALSCAFFTSCSDDDDMSQTDMEKYLLDNENDVIAGGFFGKVKQADGIFYNNAEWKDNALVKGQPAGKEVVKFDNNGYMTEKLTYRYMNSTYKLQDSIKITATDSKGRYTEKMEYEIEGVDTTYTKIVVTYDDAAKRATTIESTSKNGKTFTDIEKRVVSLRGDGRINEEDPEYEATYTLRSDQATNAEELNNISEKIGQKDSQGNWTSYYEKLTNSDKSISIYSCYDATYLYY